MTIGFVWHTVCNYVPTRTEGDHKFSRHTVVAVVLSVLGPCPDGRSRQGVRFVHYIYPGRSSGGQGTGSVGIRYIGPGVRATQCMSPRRCECSLFSLLVSILNIKKLQQHI